MASKWINVILWTLVSVNLITLVLGGLVTWLGYAIPIRLRQFGLSPEITQLAGFASLLVACLGLGGLNYSSHYALNVYGLSCAIFIILMLFGALPDHWQRAIYNPSHSLAVSELHHDHGHGHHHQQPTAQQHSPTNDTKPAGGVGGIQANVTSKRLKPDQSHGAGLILDLLYIVLLFVLSVLLALAFILASYLRRRELEEVDEADNELVAATATASDCYDQELGSSGGVVVGGGGGGPSFLQRESVDWNTTTTLMARRRLLSAVQTTNDLTPDWGCTCGSGGGELFNNTEASGISMALDSQATSSTMAVTNHQANKEFAASVGGGGGHSAGPEEDKKSPATRRMVSSVAEEALHQARVDDDDGDGHDQLQDSIRRRSSQSATLDHYKSGGRRHGSGDHYRRTSRISSRLGSDTGGQLLFNARRVSSKSLADLTIDSDDVDEDDDDGDGHENGAHPAGGNGRAAAHKDTAHIAAAAAAAPPPLIQKGIYYASGCGLDCGQCTGEGGGGGGGGNQTAGSVPFAHFAQGRTDSARQRRRGPNDDHNHYHHSRNRSHCHYNHHNHSHHHSHHHSQHQQRFRTRFDSEASQCCCSDLASTGRSNKAAATLAAKLNPSPAINYDPTFLNNYLQQCRRLGSTELGIRSIYNPNTMPNKGWLQ